MNTDPLNLYRILYRIRRFEETVDDLYSRDLVKGSTHLYIGEEAMATGVCACLRTDDYITSTHRGHGHCIAKGARLDRMLAELLGRSTGYGRGRGGSMHIADPSTGNLGANGVVAGSVAIAAGAALSATMRSTDQVVACFFGDGGANQGILHESMNLAAIWKLPVIYVCENNRYGMSVPFEKASSVERVAERGRAYNMPGTTVDGMDVLAVIDAVKPAVERARAGGGPSLIEGETYRYLGHSKNDPRSYRSKEEEALWRSRDPIKRMGHHLVESGSSQTVLDQVHAEVEQEIREAIQFATESPWPDTAELEQDVFA